MHVLNQPGGADIANLVECTWLVHPGQNHAANYRLNFLCVPAVVLG